MFYVCLISCALFAIYANGENCDSLGVRFYEYLGCKGNYANGKSSCPIAYKCPKFQLGPGFCMVRGQRFSNKESIKATQRCSFCECSAESNEAGFMECAASDCPEMDIKEGCWIRNSLTECCPKTLVCASDEAPVNCNVDGMLYNEGEFFYPQGKCWECVCQKGFSGVYEEPHCRRQPCDTELFAAKEIQKKCAPVYYDNGMGVKCCPSKFMCPEDVTDITEQRDCEEPTGPQCIFGDKKYNVKDKLAIKSQFLNATCTCSVPPLIACVEDV